MNKCSICGKKTRIGRNRSHAQNRSSRKFKANIQKVIVSLGDKKVAGTFCTSCIKRLRKDYRDKQEAKEEILK